MRGDTKKLNFSAIPFNRFLAHVDFSPRRGKTGRGGGGEEEYTESVTSVARVYRAFDLPILTIEARRQRVGEGGGGGGRRGYWRRVVGGDSSETRLLLSTKLITLFGNRLRRKARRFHALRCARG